MKNTFTRQELVDKIKEFCEHELDAIDRFGYDAKAATTRCFGALMFIVNVDDFDEDLSDWWDNEMHAKFREKGGC